MLKNWISKQWNRLHICNQYKTQSKCENDTFLNYIIVIHCVRTGSYVSQNINFVQKQGTQTYETL